jgi:hypothetical protein
MDASYQPDPVVFSSVLLAERLVFGFLFAAHGTGRSDGIADWSTRLIWAVLAGGALARLTNVLAARQRVPSRAPLSR